MKNWTPQQAADKWASRFAAAIPDIKIAVQMTTKDPARLAIAQQDKAVSNYTNALTSGRWAARLGRVTPEQWKQAYINKALPVLADRARQAKGKYEAFARAWKTFQDGVAQELASMPRGSLEQNIARAVHVIRKNREFKERGFDR